MEVTEGKQPCVGTPGQVMLERMFTGKNFPTRLSGAWSRTRTGQVLSLFCVAPLLLLAAGGCRDVAKSHASSQKSDVLAQVDDTVITVSEFQERINSQTPYVRARYNSPEHKKEFLDNLVKFEIFASEARKKGYDRDPEVVRSMKQVMIQKLLKQEFDKVRIEDITESEIQQYFDTHQDKFNKPAEVRVSMILVPNEAAAKKVLEDARVKGIENAGFRELVAQYSTDLETKERGGDLRFFDHKSRELPKEIVDSAFRMVNIGDVSEPVKTQKGVALLKLTGQRKALVRALDDVKQQIRSTLFNEKRQAMMGTYEQKLRKEAKVEVHEDRLSRVLVDPSPPGSEKGALSPAQGTFHPPFQNAPQASPAMPGGSAPAPAANSARP